MLEISENGQAGKETAAALGVFDGVHLGHRAVMGRAAEYGRENGLAPAVCTFKTDTISTKGSDFLPIFTEEKKLSLLTGEGIEYVYDPDFAQVRDMSAEDFVKDILMKKLRARAVVCGSDFRLGKNAACGVKELGDICKGLGIELMPVGDVTDGGEKISSARIRQLIRQGDVSGAARLLGGCYCVDGKVVSGNRLGRKLSFPTANQVIPTGTVCPMFGVYVSRAFIDGEYVKGITNIGVKPTVGYEGVPLAETHFLDYSGGLYGREISLEILEFVRPERRFESQEELKKQIASDIETARGYFLDRL